MVKTVVFEEEYLKMVLQEVRIFMDKWQMVGNFVYSQGEHSEITGADKSLDVYYSSDLEFDIDYYDEDSAFARMMLEKYGIWVSFNVTYLTPKMVKDTITVRDYSKIPLSNIF